MEKIRIEEKRLFDEFQNTWNLEKVKNMTLEEYTGIKSSGERNDFTYWIEKKLENLGSIWGGSSFKFCVYRRDSTEAKEQYKGRAYNENYAWLEKYGSTPEKAFEKVKTLIIQVIEYSQNNELTKIDEIDLGHAYKWKIAFHYQNPDDMKMFCIFQQNTLKKIAENELSNGNLPTSQIYMKLMSDKKYTLEDSCNERSIPLWKKYNINDDSYDENSQSNINKNKVDTTKTTPPLNQILYGPLGTGKTYSTVDKVLEVLHCYGEIDTIPKERKDKKALFDKYCKGDNRQIEFVTFHQSFSYEEFVEGIKPKFVKKSKNPSNETEKKSKKMIYKVKSGIFKEICNRALYKEYQFKSGESEIQANTKTRVWKISIVAKSEDKKLRDEVLKHCFEKGEIRIGWSDNRTQEQISMLGRNDRSSIYQFEKEADIGDIVCVFENANGDIKGIGMIEESKFYWDDDTDNSEALKLYPRVRKVKWLSKEHINIRDLNGGIGLTLKTFYPLDRVDATELLTKCKLDEKNLIIDNTQKPFVLIIDEINRGNISKILGELITLIEPSKRIGASDEEKARGIGDESLEVTLPYSNEIFGVPSNLYIIGTMNTADRSIALLDTALRRRFEFIEMMPDCKELQKIWLVGNDEDYENSSIDEWNAERAKVLYEILTAINNRIEFLLDREHTIGHAFFFEKAIKEDGYFVLSLDSLKEIFAKKIIPLLQEYFYDDYAKIQAVLNDNGMIKSFSKQKLEVNLSDDFVDSDKKVYRITDSNMWKKENFQRIYDSSIKIDENE